MSGGGLQWKIVSLDFFKAAGVKLCCLIFFYRLILTYQTNRSSLETSHLKVAARSSREITVQTWPGQEPHREVLKLIKFVLERHSPDYGIADLAHAPTGDVKWLKLGLTLTPQLMPLSPARIYCASRLFQKWDNMLYIFILPWRFFFTKNIGRP